MTLSALHAVVKTSRAHGNGALFLLAPIRQHLANEKINSLTRAANEGPRRRCSPGDSARAVKAVSAAPATSPGPGPGAGQPRAAPPCRALPRHLPCELPGCCVGAGPEAAPGPVTPSGPVSPGSCRPRALSASLLSAAAAPAPRYGSPAQGQAAPATPQSRVPPTGARGKPPLPSTGDGAVPGLAPQLPAGGRACWAETLPGSQRLRVPQSPRAAGFEGETIGNLVEDGAQGLSVTSSCFLILLILVAGLDTLPSIGISLFSLERTKENLKALKPYHTRFHFSSYFGFHFLSCFYRI